MDKGDIEQKRDAIITRLGPWTAHCIHLGDNTYTFQEPHWDTRLRRFLQIASDIIGKPFDNVRVADLACLEGHFGLEFALHGAEVVGVEGRSVNLEKSEFARDILAQHKFQLTLDDVRNFSKEKYGSFEIILCLGILYHLDTPDVMEFVRNLANTCDRVAIIDTHVSLEDTASYSWRGNSYFGGYFPEHKSESQDEQSDKLWHSVKNVKSFWFTLPSLCNLLRHVGFTSVYECLNPYEYHNPGWPHPARDDRYVVWRDRVTLVAIKGCRQTVMSSPITEASPDLDRPEKADYIKDVRLPGVPAARRNPIPVLTRFLPARLKQQIHQVIK
jgi:hypothetical protein